MASVTLITGGCRSGKSVFAEQRALSYPKERVYIATAIPCDDEMRNRISKHQRARGDAFTTIEAPYELSQCIGSIPSASIILIDCLTVWCGNLMYIHNSESAPIEKACSNLVKSLQCYTGDVILVTNEVGMGIVPENTMARLFRDHAGILNRCIAEIAAEVYLVVAGIQIKIK